MNIRLQNGLPIVSVTLTYNDQSVILQNVLFDTGCAATVFDTDHWQRLIFKLTLLTDKLNECTG
ncbi:hypothetical protein D3C74_69420 [compost metagenome]